LADKYRVAKWRENSNSMCDLKVRVSRTLAAKVLIKHQAFKTSLDSLHLTDIKNG